MFIGIQSLWNLISTKAIMAKYLQDDGNTNVKLRSNRAVKHAVELIGMLAEAFGLEKNSRYKEKDYVADLEAKFNERNQNNDDSLE